MVIWHAPGPHVPGATDGRRIIWLDPRLNQAERRCVLTHELVHLEAGHRGCQPYAVEGQVRAAAAALLIPLSDLLDAVRWSPHVSELADTLWVTEQVIADRIRWLSREELQQVLDAAAHHLAP